MLPRKVWPKATIPLVLLIVIALILVVTHGTRLLTQLGSYRDADGDNRTWNVVQLEVDHKELKIAILNAQLSPDGSVDAERQIRDAFDIYYSRVEAASLALAPAKIDLTLDNGGSFSSPEWLDSIVESRDEIAALIDGSAFLTPQDIDRLAELSFSEGPKIRDVTTSAIQRFTRLEEAKRLEQYDLLLRLDLMLAGLFVMMSVAVVLAVLVSKESANRARRADRTASNLRKTFEASLDAVVVSDEIGNITYLNSAASRMFGVHTGDPMRALIFGSIAPEHAENDEVITEMDVPDCNFSAPLAERGRQCLTGLHGSGVRFPMEASIVSDTDSDGQPVCIGFFRDTSGQVEAEQKLRDARDNAQQDAAAKSRFLAVMSHEMRTPLHGMIAALDLISTDTLSSVDHRFLKTARACSLSALAQVNDVLEVTRGGAAEVTLTQFNPQTLAADLIADLLPLAQERGNDLSLQSSPDCACPPVVGWQRGFLLVLRNLISNAVKFTSDGEIVVSIRFEPATDGLVALEISVTDTGVGIDQADHERVFQEFEALDKRDSSAGGGVGLGLAIARSEVERMGGKISLESTLGQGSCFSFRLMLGAAQNILPVEAHDKQDRTTEASVPEIQQRHILVVDDNNVNLVLMAEMLQRIGHRPETALDGPTAIALAHKTKFDLILMDILMPGMDGLATTQAIRAGGASGFCPIVGVTALVLEEDRARILEVGMQDVLGKPLGLARLRSYLAEFFAENTTAEDEFEAFDEVRAFTGDAMMVGLLHDVQQDCETALKSLRTADKDEDLNVARQALHRASGSAAVIGASALAESLREGQRAIIAGDRAALKSCEAEIMDKISAVERFFFRIQAK